MTALAYLAVAAWAAVVLVAAWRETQRSERAIADLEREADR